jgi:hypothetical protein
MDKLRVSEAFCVWILCEVLYCIVLLDSLCGNSTTWPCGLSTEETKCYENIGKNISNGAETACATACSNAEHYVIDPSNNGKCVLRECASRTKNASLTQPCGPGSCYWDQGDKTGSNNKCIASGTACTNAGHYSMASTSRFTCELLGCAQRSVNSSFVCI